MADLRRRVRALYLLHGVGRVAAVLAGLLVLSFALDLALAPPLAVRVIHSLLSLGALALASHRFLAVPLGRPLSDDEVAAAVEARVPSLEDRLAGALQWERLLADPENGESRAFMEASAAEAVQAVRRVRASTLTDARSSRRSLGLGAVAAAACLLVLATHADAAAIWARRSLLLMDEAWPRRTTLLVVGFDPAVPREVTAGEDLPLEVRVEGDVPGDGVTLRYETVPAEGAPAERDARPMLQSSEDPRSFVFVFHEVPSSFLFSVAGGDDDDGLPVYRVRALVPPGLESVTARLTYPPASGMAPEEKREGDLEVPSGTRVDLVLRASVPIASAAFVYPPGTAPAALAVEPDGRTFRTSAVVTQTGDWRADMVGVDGARSVPGRTSHRFTAVADPRPEARLLHPSTHVLAVADGRVPVRVLATDNFGLEEAGLRISPGRDRPPVDLPFALPRPAPAAPAPAPAPRRFVGTRMIDLGSLVPPDGEGRGLRPGDEVVLRATAKDNGGSTAVSDEVVVEVAEPAEIERRIGQRLARLREDLAGVRRRCEEARTGAGRAARALEGGGALEAPDRESLRDPVSSAGRAVRESAGMAAAVGDIVLTQVLNRIPTNRAASERVVALLDEGLRQEGEDPAVVFPPSLWRRVTTAYRAREFQDDEVLGAMVETLDLTDRLSAGPATRLREDLASLSTGEATDPAARAASAVKAAAEALALVEQIEVRLQRWETLQELLEAFRALYQTQIGITDQLRTGPATPAPPKGR